MCVPKLLQHSAVLSFNPVYSDNGFICYIFFYLTLESAIYVYKFYSGCIIFINFNLVRLCWILNPDLWLLSYQWFTNIFTTFIV